MLTSWVAAPRPSGGQLMTYGRSIMRALETFNIPKASWATLAEDRAAWRDAIHGGLLVSERPKRAAAAAADRLIDVALTDAKASILDETAAIRTTLARAKIAAAPPQPPAPRTAPAAPQRRGQRVGLMDVQRGGGAPQGPLNAAQQ